MSSQKAFSTAYLLLSYGIQAKLYKQEGFWHCVADKNSSKYIEIFGEE